MVHTPAKGSIKTETSRVHSPSFFFSPFSFFSGHILELILKGSWVVEDPRLQAKKPRTQKNTQMHATCNPKKVHVCAVSALRKGLCHPQLRGPFPYLGTANTTLAPTPCPMRQTPNKRKKALIVWVFNAAALCTSTNEEYCTPKRFYLFCFLVSVSVPV